MLDVGRLRVLLAISEHGGLPAAARALGTPAGDASAQLSGLERELGLTLVEGDRLTPAGRRLAVHGGRLLAQLEAAESDAAAVANRASGVLRLGIGAAAGRALLPDALAMLRTTAPELELRVQQLADERIDALGTERLDVVVVGEFPAAVPRRGDADTERRELLTEPLLVAVPGRHRVTGVSVRLAELAGERWVGGAQSGDALVALERAAAAAGFEPLLVGHAGEDGLALALVAAGLGIALVPASSVPLPVEGVRFLTAVDAGLRRTVTAAVRRSAATDPGVLRLLDALGQAARRVAAAVSGVTAATPPPGGPAAGRDPYGALPGAVETRGRPSPPADLAARRPDPLFDPLPPGRAGAELAAADRSDPTGPGGLTPDLPGPRRQPAAEPWSGHLSDPPGSRRESGLESPANGAGYGPGTPGGYGTALGAGNGTAAGYGNGTPAGYGDQPAGTGGYGAPTSPYGTPVAPHGGVPDPYTSGAELPGRRRDHRDRPADTPADRRSPDAADLPGARASRESAQEPPRRRGAPSEPAAADPRPRPAAPPGALPPPGVPADRPRPGHDAGRVPPPLPHPTSPDLGVRSLVASELPGLRPGGGATRAGGTQAQRPAAGGQPRRGRAEARGESGGESGMDTLPPAPPGSAEEVRLSIFEDLQSEWFVQREEGPPRAAWQTAADDGWRAAARLAEPTTAGTTTAGLPRRRPQALYVPGAVGAGDGGAGDAPLPNGAANRSPQEVRGRLSSYRDGVRRGRHADPSRED